MKLPTHIKSQGVELEVKETEITEMSETESFGWYQPEKQKVLIRANLPDDTKVKTLLHEIIEVINHQFELKLTHNKITIFESALHQILKDNPNFVKLYLDEPE